MPTSDLSEFEALGSPKSRCWFLHLTADQRVKVDAAKEAGYSHTTVAAVVTGWGYPIKRSAISSHYQKGHNCGG